MFSDAVQECVDTWFRVLDYGDPTETRHKSYFRGVCTEVGLNPDIEFKDMTDDEARLYTEIMRGWLDLQE